MPPKAIDPKAEQKKIETTKKAFQLELKKLSSKIKKPRLQLMKLEEMKLKLDEIKQPSAEDKDKLKKIDLGRKGLLKLVLKEANSTSKRLNDMLKKEVSDDKKAIPVWQKGMDKWYRDILNKDSGFEIGNGLRLNGDLSIKKKEASLSLSGKM